jgi:DNA polymerase-1
MIVTIENFHMVIETKGTLLSIDTETTGLSSFKDDCLFSIIISDDEHDYYLNFKDYEDQKALPKGYLQRLKPLLEDESKIWVTQNAKFDLHMLAKEGLFIKGKIYDLMFLDRTHYNQHMSYRLSDITKRWGEEKLDTVMEYITENKLWTNVEYPEYGKAEKNLHFDKVPFKLISDYGMQDGRGTLNTGKKILSALRNEDRIITEKVPPQLNVVENEARLVHTLFRMEQVGAKIDTDYCREALKYYFDIIKDVEVEFKKLTGLDFVKGTTVFEQVFSGEQEKWEKTEKGNWKWDADTLSKFTHPAARLAVGYAEAKKQSEYFANFLYYSDKEGVIHPNFKQSGTVTSRFSCDNPNLQNMSAPDKYDEDTEAAKYAVRRAIVPREGYFLAMIDYAQSEFRMFLEYARPMKLINEILTGKDVHTATAEIAKVTRKEAKTINFGLLYGQGIGKLTCSLFNTKCNVKQVGAIYKHILNWKITPEERQIYSEIKPEDLAHDEALVLKAMDIKKAIFAASPEINDCVKSIQKTAENRGYIRNFYGRRYYFTDKRFAYKATNHLIQGTCADMLKFAMNKIDELLLDKKTQMILSIHDELVFQVFYGEEYLLPQIKKIMEEVYPHKLLPQIAEISWSKTSLAEKLDWEDFV